MTQRVKMNDLFKENGRQGIHIDLRCDLRHLLSGEIEIYIDGESVLLATGLILRTEEGPDGRVQGLHLQTFFGGAFVCQSYTAPERSMDSYRSFTRLGVA